MALTKEDLQAIRGLVQEELKPIRGLVQEELKPIRGLVQEELQAIRVLMQEELEPIKSRLGVLEEGQQQLEEKVDVVRQSQLNVELTELPRIAAALDGVVAAAEKNKTQDERISIVESRLDYHGDRISSLELALKAK